MGTLRIYWKYLAGSSFLPPSGPFPEARVARSKALVKSGVSCHQQGAPSWRMAGPTKCCCGCWVPRENSRIRIQQALVMSQCCFSGLPEKQELPNSSDLLLNKCNTPSMGGSRNTGIWNLHTCGHFRTTASLTTELQIRREWLTKADSDWRTSQWSRGPKTLTVAKTFLKVSHRLL